MEQLFNIVLVTSYQATIVGIFIIIIKLLLKNKLSPKWNYLIWIIFVVKLIVPFGPKSSISIFNQLPTLNNQQIILDNGKIKTNINNNESINKNISNVNESVSNQIKNDTKTIIESKESNSFDEKSINNNIYSSMYKYLPYIWVIGVINILAFTILMYHILNSRLKYYSLNANDNIYSVLEKSKLKIKVNSKIKIIISKYISTPALTGILKPKILLPLNMIDLDEEELTYIILHELSHYKRKDIFVNYILLLLQAIHWFNPIIWIFMKKIREDMEFATDEKVLNILDNKYHKNYAQSILSVIEKSNTLTFYPSLVSMASDKNKVEKRIRRIKQMKFIKSRKFIFTTVGILVILIIAPIMLTSANKEHIKSKDYLNKELKKVELSNLANDYINIVNEKIKGTKIDNEKLSEIVKNINLVEQDGYISKGYVDDRYEELRSVNFNENNEKVSVTYSYSKNKRQDITDIHYLNKNKNGYINGIHAIYDIKDVGLDSFKVNIGSVSVNDQKNLVEYINELSKDNEIYAMYYKFAQLTRENSKFPDEELKKIPENLKGDIGSNQIAIGKNDTIVVLISDEGLKNIYGVKLIDNKNNILLYTKSEIGQAISVNGKESNISETTINSNSINEQKELLIKISTSIQKSIPEKVSEVLDKETIENNKKIKNELVGMKLMQNISYSSELNPKLLTINESIDYIKLNTRDDIVEVESNYIETTGITKVTYKSGDKKYIVRYMHPYKKDKDGNILNEYDRDNTVGIYIYENEI